MMKKLKQRSIRQRLMLIFLLITIIPLLIMSIGTFAFTKNGLSDLSDDKQKEVMHIVQAEITNIAEELLAITELYGDDEGIIEALRSNDHQHISEEIDGIYPRLNKEHDLTVLELGDKNGNVVYRGHNPTKFGDDKSEIPAIQIALDGQAISGFEFGSSGLSVRAFVPIVNNNEVIGTLQTGLDASFLEEMQKMLNHVTIDLYNSEGVILLSSMDENIGVELDNAEVLGKVSKGDTVALTEGESAKSYLPIYDPTHQNIIGMIGITQDISIVSKTEKGIIMITILLLVLAILAVTAIAIVVSKAIAKPIKQVSNTMVELSEGKLNMAIDESNRTDEIGQLINTSRTLKENLSEIIKEVTKASTHVTKNSEELLQSADEVKNGTENIANTMQEIAMGSEKQAVNTNDLAVNMNHFSSNIQATSDKGNSLLDTSNNVLEMVHKGKELMETSTKQMDSIHILVKDAVDSVEGLDEKSQKISGLVSAIEDISQQTNLLALNAAIEAARAGEHGQGFGVVAEEVRKLADQVSYSVTDISQILSEIQNETKMVVNGLTAGYDEVQKGSQQITTTGETFLDIDSAISHIVQEIKEIANTLSNTNTSSKDMSETIQEMAAFSEESSAGVEETSATIQQTASMMEEVSNSANTLTKLAENMDELVKRFKL